jgi:hypothetical protein
MTGQEYRQTLARGGHFRSSAVGPVVKKKPLVMPVAVLSVNNLIGEDDVFDSFGFYRTAVKCISQTGELLMMTLEDFRRCEDFKMKVEGGKIGEFKPFMMAEIKRKQQAYRRAIRSRLAWQKDASVDAGSDSKGRPGGAYKISRKEFAAQ